ncbi:MAG TPA: hypothetical protein VE288_15405 [Rubrobacteraceae bacterium]|nr:hypothetical protein [Rubrobacteraceae bacterium]
MTWDWCTHPAAADGEPAQNHAGGLVALLRFPGRHVEWAEPHLVVSR